MKVPGRLHPVEIFFTQEPEKYYLEATITMVVQIHINEPPGDMLIFLTGEEEIEDACRKITREVQNLGDQDGPLKLFLYIQPFLHPCNKIYLTQLHILYPYYQDRNMLTLNTNIPLNVVKLVKGKSGIKYDVPFPESCPHLVQDKLDLQDP
jgi:hypothetical protein